MSAVINEDDRRVVIQVMFIENKADWVEVWIKTGKIDPKPHLDLEGDWNRKAQFVADYRVRCSTEGQGRHLRWRALTEKFDGKPMWSLRPAEEDSEAISSMLDGTVWWDEEVGWSTWDGEGDSLSYGNDWQEAFQSAERIYGCTADRPTDPNVG